MKAAALVLAVSLAGCGASSTPTTTRSVKRTIAPTRTTVNRPTPVALAATSGPRLPTARSGVAAATFRGRLFVIGGLTDAGTSSDTVFAIDPDGRAVTDPPLPGPVHDAAAAVVGDRLLLFGGGEFEGSDRIIAVRPGQPRQIGTLPQSLSDLDAVTIGGVAYVVGGWNGSATNRDIYAVRADGSVSVAGRLPIGVRYAAAGALGGRLIVAGGEISSGAAITRAWSFDPGTGRVARLPDLPAPIDHASGIALGTTFYVLGGLRNGAFSSAILALTPDAHRWHLAGHLPGPVADGGAAPFEDAIALAAGRDDAGKRDGVTVLRPR